MTNAQRYLEIVRRRGKNREELRKVYRNMRNKELFLMAYANLYANDGATTPGIDPNDTVDGMSLKRIDNILQRLESGTFIWKPVRRTYLKKKSSSTLRPLGMPGWNDKLVQEVMRMMLEAYDEPQFRASSHGFRPHRGCHTALREISYTWSGTKWFIETDIKGCFDSIDQDVLIGILGRHIKDERFLKLIRGMVKAGYVEDWKYNTTYSGTPQGGIISPLLANIVLNELDVYVEDVLIPKYTKGDSSKRKRNRIYEAARQRAYQAKKRGDKETYRKAKEIQRSVPVNDPNDLNVRRLRYVRYADDSLLGFIGSYEEAERIKKELKDFLNGIKLDMSEEKTLITHARTRSARFLNYLISIAWNDKERAGKGQVKIRGKNGTVRLAIPEDVKTHWIANVQKDNVVRHRTEFMRNSDYDIIMSYESSVQGLINSYQMAHNVVPVMGRLRYVYGESLVKTLATKYQTSVKNIYRKYGMYSLEGKRVIAVKIEREGKKPLIASDGKIPIRQNRNVIVMDEKPKPSTYRTEIVQRLLNNECELCGKAGAVEGHHIRKLADIKDRKNKSEWMLRMIALRRKTLFVCKKCHKLIHHGKYDGKKLA
jgi:group II intron reverse transcriptase/maturase